MAASHYFVVHSFIRSFILRLQLIRHHLMPPSTSSRRIDSLTHSRRHHYYYAQIGDGRMQRRTLVPQEENQGL